MINEVSVTATYTGATVEPSVGAFFGSAANSCVTNNGNVDWAAAAATGVTAAAGGAALTRGIYAAIG